MKKLCLNLLVAALVVISAEVSYGDVITPLDTAIGGAPFTTELPGALLTAGNTSTVGDDNGWVYDPDNPSVTPPEQTGFGAGNEFITQNSDAENWWAADINAGSTTLRYLDVWGRDDYAGAEETRHQDLVITLYDGAGATGSILFQSTAWNGVSLSTDNPASYGRFDFLAEGATTTALSQAASVRIDHSPGNTDYLLLTEVRAAGVAVPEPSTFALAALGLGGLLLWARRKRA